MESVLHWNDWKLLRIIASRSIAGDGWQGGPSHPIRAGQCRWTLSDPGRRDCNAKWPAVLGWDRRNTAGGSKPTILLYSSLLHQQLTDSIEQIWTPVWISQLWSVNLTRFRNAPNGQSGNISWLHYLHKNVQNLFSSKTLSYSPTQ